MTGAIASFSSMAIAGRAIAETHDTFELMFYRSLVGIVIVLAVGATFGTLGQINRDRLGLHAVRNISHFAGQNLWFFAVPLIPLAQVFALEFTSPLWVTVLAPLVLGEKLTRVRAIAAVMGFVGILIVARPEAGSGLSVGTVSAALSAIGFAGSALCTKLLTRTATTTCILFWLTVMQAVFGLVTAGWDGQITAPTMGSLPWIVLVGIAGLTAHFCLTTALTLAPAVIVVPMDFLRLPAIAVVGVLFYDEPLSAALILGAAIILCANLLNIRAEARR